MEKKAIKALILTVIFFMAGFNVTGQNSGNDNNVEYLMKYLRSHWDDIHDVIMRFHMDDPALKGTVFISMTWENGILENAVVDSNSTGNEQFGPAIIEAMKNWKIPEIQDTWQIVVPFRTMIYGSDRPDFKEKGIFTGKVMTASGEPVAQAKVILDPVKGNPAKADTAITNREGIFIRTLIPPGIWEIRCIREGYQPFIIEDVDFKKKGHIKTSIILQAE
ncbi:MAG: carboxypeptidase regulatory-like domain-containing protein [Bacteroidetes bacterium]|nr:carboxypeptidase regulatory-like domain-containing protein [Bacteroidota bacterium]